ncbi:MAG: 6-pyruvoyl-tetrahydropterin synthase-related protein [Pseudomonadota bacterium]
MSLPSQPQDAGLLEPRSRELPQRPINTDSLTTSSTTTETGGWLARRITLAGVVSAILLASYAVMFVASLKGRWFHRGWATDDATQQTYPLFEALYPGRFDNDLVTEVMRGCLPPLHYWLSYGVTLLTKDPIMTGHWVNLIQLSLAVGFFFCAIRALSSSVPAMLAVLWLLHSRNTIQRMTGGLPRGWTPAIFGAFLYFAVKRNHWGALATILLGAMLNPPGALIVGVAYGMLLLWRWVASGGDARVEARRRVWQSVLVAPLFVIVALVVVQRPAHIGQMVSFTEASQMPEFQKPLGRFPFLPLRPAFDEFQMFGLQAFIGRLYRPEVFWRENTWWLVGAGLTALALIGFRRRRVAIPAELTLFGIAALCTWGLSRAFAFRLFVPDRHLQIPMVFFMSAAFAVGIWRALGRNLATRPHQPDSSLRRSWPALIAFGALGWVVYQCSGSGLQGDANFNYPSGKRGGMYSWIRDNTPTDALVASHPTHCDGMQLFAVRRALVTTETSHPFYPRYNAEMRRRSEISLRAHYAELLEELVTLLRPEGVTHFVFRRADFRPEVLAKVSYFPPLNRVVRDLVTRPSGTFVFNQLPKQLDPVNYPYVKFIDDISVVIDVEELAKYLRGRGWSPPQSSLGASLHRHAASRHTVVAHGVVDLSDYAG